ncbi:AI-2E family transporter [Catenovulum sp. SM1970]|uniref:AI-2E family transporter n=1 Tax=Marinifaba aquimaris TaxID=2741323 RepID=UPI001572F2C3|nr:AI-2E family transporter [Marinifaba aquimaris]NTS77727.1 AI-2E family transporter [Marinifaba aquimaris]
MQLQLQSSPALRLLVTCACIIIILAGVKWSAVILEPFLLSVFVAIICQPVITFLANYRVPKWLSVICVIATVVVIGMSLASVVAQSINQFSQDIPVYKTQLRQDFNWLADHLVTFNIELNREMIVKYFDPAAAMSLATNMVSGAGNVLANFLLILLISVFMLFEANSLTQKLHLALDDPQHSISKIEGFLDSVKNYLAIKTAVSLATGLAAGLLCWIVGVDYFVLWGIIAFLFNYIPTIGSIIAAVPVILLALLQVGVAGAGQIGIGYLLINLIMGNVIEPKFMGKGLGISTLVVFLSLIFWGWLLGTIGMFLSVPLTMVLKVALEASDEYRWLATFLASEEEVQQELDEVEAAEEKNPVNQA